MGNLLPVLAVILCMIGTRVLVWYFLVKRRQKAPRPAAPPPPERVEAEPEQPEEPEEPEGPEPPGDFDWDEERDSRAWQELAEGFEAAGQPDEAIRALQAAVKTLGEDQADRAFELHKALAALCIRRQAPQSAYDHLAAACACAVLCFGSPSAQQAWALSELGRLLEGQGSWAKAYEKYREALETEQALYKVSEDRVAAAHAGAARMCERLADWPEALEHYLEAYRILGGEAALEDVRHAYLADGRDMEVFEEWINR